MKGKNQLLVGLRGSFENMTATIAKDGDTILKGKIKQMTNPNSEGQQFTRTRFTHVRETAALLAKYAPNTFEVYNVMQSEYNARTSHGMIESKEMDPFALADLLEAWNFTRGDAYQMAFAHDGDLSVDNEDGTYNVAVTWEFDAENPAQVGTDLIKAIVFNPSTQLVQILNTGATRADETGLVLANVPAEGVSYIAFFAQSADGTLVSTQAASHTLDSEAALTSLL